MIPYGRQEITQADVDAVVAVLRSDFLTQGPAVPRFEEAFARRTGARFAVAVNSATSALHVACLALGLGPGDVLWTVPNTFVASSNCALYCGASVDFVDIDPKTWCMSVPALRAKLESARKTGTLPKVVVPVHFSGQATEQEAIHALSREFGFRIIEDASHAVGAARNGEPVGSCRWSDITVLSFHPVKIITTGEGGLALTNDPELAERMQLFRSHGITRNAERFEHESSEGLPGAPSDTTGPAAWYYEQQLLGYNYRITDILATLGLSQVDRLDEYVARRNAIARRYDAELAGLPLQRPTLLPGNLSAYHLYVVRVKPDAARSRRQVFDELRRRDIGVNLHYMPVHLQPYYRSLGFHRGQFPEAEAYGDTAISIPMFPSMGEAAQTTVIEGLGAALGNG